MPPNLNKGVIWPAEKMSFKYQGIFSLVDLYKYMIELLMDEGYIDGSSYQHMEKYYSDKTSSTREAHSMWIWWRTLKGEEGSTFFKRHIDITYHLRYGKMVEVMYEGKKIKAEQGEIEITLDGYVVFDPEDKWKNHWLLKHLLDFYIKRFWRKSRDRIKKSAQGDVIKVNSQIKEFFELPQYHSMVGEAFYPQRGVKDNF